jgi:serine/threonine protein kinase
VLTIPFSQVFPPTVPPDAIDLLDRLLVYSPQKRPIALFALTHPFFDELRDPRTRLPNGNPLPELFNFSEQGLFLSTPSLFLPFFLCVIYTLTISVAVPQSLRWRRTCAPCSSRRTCARCRRCTCCSKDPAPQQQQPQAPCRSEQPRPAPLCPCSRR